jgi:CheY-like chemotaxis protein
MGADAMNPNALILNVDDNLGARHAKTRLLMNARFGVEAAADGTDALAMVSRLFQDQSRHRQGLGAPDLSGADQR